MGDQIRGAGVTEREVCPTAYCRGLYSSPVPCHGDESPLPHQVTKGLNRTLSGAGSMLVLGDLLTWVSSDDHSEEACKVE